MGKILRDQPNYINSVPKMLCKTREKSCLEKGRVWCFDNLQLIN